MRGSVPQCSAAGVGADRPHQENYSAVSRHPCLCNLAWQ